MLTPNTDGKAHTHTQTHTEQWAHQQWINIYWLIPCENAHEALAQHTLCRISIQMPTNAQQTKIKTLSIRCVICFNLKLCRKPWKRENILFDASENVRRSTFFYFIFFLLVFPKHLRITRHLVLANLGKYTLTSQQNKHETNAIIFTARFVPSMTAK